MLICGFKPILLWFDLMILVCGGSSLIIGFLLLPILLMPNFYRIEVMFYFYMCFELLLHSAVNAVVVVVFFFFFSHSSVLY